MDFPLADSGLSAKQRLDGALHTLLYCCIDMQVDMATLTCLAIALLVVAPSSFLESTFASYPEQEEIRIGMKVWYYVNLKFN